MKKLKNTIITVTHVGNSKSRRNQTDSFLVGLRLIVFIGRCVGIIPRNDMLNKIPSRTFTFSFIFSSFVTFYLFTNAVLHSRATFFLLGRKWPSITQKLWDFQNPGWATSVFLIFAYFLRSSKKLRNVVQTFVELNHKFPSSSIQSNFTRFCWLVTMIYLAFGIAENVYYDLQVLQKAANVAKTSPSLELYYKTQFSQWSGILPYHPVLSSIHVGIDKCGYIGWLLADVLAIALCRAVSEKFRSLDESAMQIVKVTSGLSLKSQINLEYQMEWDGVRTQLLMLIKLTHEVEDFIVPLILTCYGINMYIIIINLLIWISPYSAVTLDQGYYVFAFFEFVFRVISVTYFAAEVHHASHSLLNTTQRCPNFCYSFSPQRIERMLAVNPPGICIFGSFMITKRFFVSIVNFLFTIEIVLLQTTGTKAQPNPGVTYIMESS